MLKKSAFSFCALLFAACAGGSRQLEAEAEPARLNALSPVLIEVKPRPLATLFYWLEQMSQWAPGTSAAWARAFNERFGLGGEEKELLRKFAFARLELDKKQKNEQPQPSFQEPFGPEGLFSPAQTLGDRYWQKLMELENPGQMAGALAEFFSPEDLHVLEQTSGTLAARVLQLASPDKTTVEKLQKLFSVPEPAQVLFAFARWLGLGEEKLRFVVVPLRAAPDVEAFAEAFSDTIFLGLAADESPAAEHLHLALHEAARRLLARLNPARKAALTLVFAEAAGHQPGAFELEEGLLDAFAFGWLPGQLKQPAVEFPGQERRRRIAKALLPVLERAMTRGLPLEGKLVQEAADEVKKAVPPRPADMINGAMVFGSESAIEAFRTAVVRWTVWKFPLEKKYDYRKKFEEQPGRTVLCILSPRDLKQLFALAESIPLLKEALGEAAVYLQRNQGVIIVRPRPLRGYIFVVAAPSPEKMKNIARAFFALKEIPSEPVTSD
jgi:hypothetical protein